MKFIGFSDLHLNNDSKPPYGENGYPVRVLDVYVNLELLVDVAIKRAVDWVFFGGDAYYTYAPPQEYRSLFHQQMLRLEKAGIKYALIPGNHDMTKKSKLHHSLKEFETLETNAIVANEPMVYHLEGFDLVAIPWMYHPLTDIEFLNNRRKGTPSICVAHCSVIGAQFQSGTEVNAELVLGHDFTLPLEFFEQFNFTLLGHIHKPQVLSDSPPVMYPGSMEFLTWGEVGDPHFFVYGEFDEDGLSHWEKINLPVRKREILNIKDFSDYSDILVSPSTMYRLNVDIDHFNDFSGLTRHFSKAFRADVFKYSTKRVQRRTEIRKLKGKSKTEQLKEWCELNQTDYEEIKELWEQLQTEVI